MQLLNLLITAAMHALDLTHHVVGSEQIPEVFVGWWHCGKLADRSQYAPGSAHWRVDEHLMP